MESEQFTVLFDNATDTYAIYDTTGHVVERRVTPGGTIAELMDLGFSQEDATARVVSASNDWRGE